MKSVDENSELAEVKAVLRHLQQLEIPQPKAEPLPLNALTARSGRAQVSGTIAPKSHLAVFEKKHAVVSGGELSGRPAKKLPRAALAAVAGVVCLGAVVGVWTFKHSRQPASGRANVEAEKPAQTDVAVSDPAVLTDARSLLSTGSVLEARLRLIRHGATTPEIAFMIAQSYDPNYIKSLAKSDAAPDPGQAEYWYRRWYDLAVSSGLDMDQERLMRIINAMR
jgi:hypothetical protein